MKPKWLRVDLPGDDGYHALSGLLKSLDLNTVCQEAHCPNISECFSRGTATFMLLGNICTRNCRYCAVAGGPPMPPDPDEPARVAAAVKKLNLNYVVLTSVTRDDLPDGGAGHFAGTIEEVRCINPGCRIEILIPDFSGDRDALECVVEMKPDVLNHNIETVERLFPLVRPRADYRRSLGLLEMVKEFDPDMATKSGLMVGLGETKEEVYGAIDDIYAAHVDIITIGQYLRPSSSHADVAKYYTPEEFSSFKDYCINTGFKCAYCGPLVRSSYHAAEVHDGI